MMDTMHTLDQHPSSHPSPEQIGRVAAVTGATATVERAAHGFGNDNPTTSATRAPASPAAARSSCGRSSTRGRTCASSWSILLDERMGKLEKRSSRMIYDKLISRIQTFRNHPRYAFMFENANIEGGDPYAAVSR
jgi:hypothetical protein